ncbi:hypothetical protein DB32_000083 [Sandaracinus amylolyticus]|uniref:Uncharacterized protein n=1 Tax=Sandaracinus amylolyticus TaxID=927083 RepID=A0A0F6YFP9_9BACT|nr:hypothetical protein DB32_000083 [Sandaracinus amylolyticus]
MLVIACGSAPPTPPSTTPEDDVTATYAEAARSGDELGYTRRAAHELGRASGLAVHVAAPRVLTVRTAQGDSEISLARPYASCVREPADCDAITSEYLASVAAMVRRSAEDGAARPERLRLALRHEETIAAYRAQLGDELIARPFVADLHVVVLVDFPESARPLLRSELPSITLDEEQAYELARRNVLEELGPMPVDASALQPGTAAGLSEGRFYESSRLLDVDALSALERGTGAAILLVVPTNDIVILASAADPTALLALTEIGAQVASRASRTLSTVVLRFTGGRIEVAS